LLDEPLTDMSLARKLLCSLAKATYGDVLSLRAVDKQGGIPLRSCAKGALKKADFSSLFCTGNDLLWQTKKHVST